MTIGALIPTRGDRTPMLNFALRQLDRQTRKPDVIIVVDDQPNNSTDKDITWRYRIGTERMVKAKADVVFLIEDDDYYDSQYIAKMLEHWENAGNPEVFGIGNTYYYHLGLKAYNQHHHAERASAFSTMVTIDGLTKMRWPKDNYSFTDIEIWKQLRGKTFVPARPLAIGMKGHQNGTLFGGIGHSNNARLYTSSDPRMDWLKSNVDEESFVFYSNIANIVGNKIILQ